MKRFGCLMWLIRLSSSESHPRKNLNYVEWTNPRHFEGRRSRAGGTPRSCRPAPTIQQLSPWRSLLTQMITSSLGTLTSNTPWVRNSPSVTLIKDQPERAQTQKKDTRDGDHAKPRRGTSQPNYRTTTRIDTRRSNKLDVTAPVTK